MIQFCPTIVDPSNHEPQNFLDESCGEIPATKPRNWLKRAFLVDRTFYPAEFMESKEMHDSIYAHICPDY